MYYLANKSKSLSVVHGTAAVFSIVSGGIVAITGFLFLSLWQSIFPGLPRTFVILAFCLAPFLLYRGLWANLMTGINLAPSVYKIQLVYSCISVLCVILLWHMQALSPKNVIWLMAGICFLSAIANLVILLNIKNHAFRPSYTLAADSLKYGLKIFPGFIANWLHFRIDQLMINWLIGVQGVGIYAVSVRWAEMLWLIGYGIINAGLFKIASQDREGSYILTKKLFKVVLFLTGSAGLLLALASRPLFAVFYGEEFKDAVWPLILLIPGVVLWDAGRVLSQYISFNRGKPYLCTIAAFIGMSVNIIGNLFTIPRWGLNGAALASAVSYSLIILYLFFIFKKLK